jgi:hypothetical protein
MIKPARAAKRSAVTNARKAGPPGAGVHLNRAGTPFSTGGVHTGMTDGSRDSGYGDGQRRPGA